MTSRIPLPSLKRLPLYYRELKRAAAQGTPYLSSKELGAQAGVPAVQVRKDLSHLNEKGKPGVGYDTAGLAAHLKDTLGLAKDKEAVLVGAGNLGQALALYSGFGAYGFQIVMLFDNDLEKVGTQVGGVEVMPVERIETQVSRLGVRIGIITTPARAAQSVADQMVAGGITAIWNFAPRNLVVPDGVFVKNEDLTTSLSVLSYAIETMQIADSFTP